MKKIILLSILVVILAISYMIGSFIYGSMSLQQSTDIAIPKRGAASSINDIVTPYLAHEKTKSLSIAVYNRGQISYLNYPSEDDNTSDDTPTNASIFEIGSISKTFTGTLLSQMVDEGKVSLDDPISKYLPKEVINWGDTISITLKELATHTSGLPRLPDNYIYGSFFNPKNPYKKYTRAYLLDFFQYYTPIAKEDRKVDYSNLGMGLLGDILAQVEGTTYEALVKHRIFDPLNMTDSYASYKKDNQVSGYDGRGKKTSAWEFQINKGAGAIRSSSRDMMKYMIANLEEQDLVRGAHQPLVKDGEHMEVGLGWFLIHPKQSDLELLFHDGGTGGFSSVMILSKEKQIGVTVLSNSVQSVDLIGFRIIELLEKNTTIAKI